MFQENIGIKGIITIHEIPVWWTDKDFKYYWPRMSRGEQRSRQVPLDDGRWQAENLITNVGITQILNNLSVTGQGNMQAFAQILSVGNGTITGVTRADTAVIGDGFTTGARRVPASFSTVGFTTTIVTNFGSGDAVGTLTNLGLYGFAVSGAQNATTLSGTGQLNTHAPFSYTKGASAIAVNYMFSLSN